MTWSSLFRRLGKLPLYVTQHQAVHAILTDPTSGEDITVPLTLKFDESGNPYLTKPGTKPDNKKGV